MFLYILTIIGFICIILAFFVFIYIYFKIEKESVSLYKDVNEDKTEFEFQPQPPQVQTFESQQSQNVTQLQRILAKKKEKKTHRDVLAQMHPHHKKHLQHSLTQILEKHVEQRKKEELLQHSQNIRTVMGKNQKTQNAFKRLKEFTQSKQK